MAILGIVLLVFFVIIAVLLVLLVLIQNEEGEGLGGIFGGGSSTALGSRSGNFLTRATTVLGALFLIVSLGLALMNRGPSGTGVERAGRTMSSEASEWFMEDDSFYDYNEFDPDEFNRLLEEMFSSEPVDGSDEETP